MKKTLINCQDGAYLAELLLSKGYEVHGLRRRSFKADILVLGVTFKENCPDIRNSKVVSVVNELLSFGTNVEVYDRLADKKEVLREYGFSLVAEKYYAIVLAVSHQEFTRLNWDKTRMNRTVIYNVKGTLDRALVTARL